jgi:hypothetical protein
MSLSGAESAVVGLRGIVNNTALDVGEVTSVRHLTIRKYVDGPVVVMYKEYAK